jgi:hypothetical protein
MICHAAHFPLAMRAPGGYVWGVAREIEMTTFRTNDFQARFRDDHGHLSLDALSALRGESFDAANDCWIDHEGAEIHVRGMRKPISIGRLGLLGATTDALLIWERSRNGEAAFAYRYADDPTEMRA